ncbi:MAG: CDP-diacylglycerol--glycerol-3-phosphate 3-phosphatidyltransferase [Deltaproteobacteria bacterium]|nr:CDP-diacylglycerol--glycerol-3-phosphate 3-phosphatidyltransferase [Deltaproteobacteria bacterium]
MSRIIQNLPNYITFSRLALIPVFVFLMVDPTQWMLKCALVVFILASLTDYVDGYIARKYGAVSDFGKLLDPVADKLLVMAALVMLVAQKTDGYGDSWVPGWMVVLVLAREIWVTGLRSVAAARGRVVPAGNAGKVKSFLQMAAVVALLLHDATIRVGGLLLTCQLIGINLLIISILVSYWGAIEYTWDILGKQPESSD